MKFKKLTIKNFRAIECVVLEDLGDLVLIAGQNGVGKSCIFDSIRLLKSSYGGYNPNEWQNWFNEFQLTTGGNKYKIDSILRNKKEPLEISATISLSESEISFLKIHGEKLIETLLWKSYTNNPNFDPIDELSGSFATNHRMYSQRIADEVVKHRTDFNNKIERNEFFASIQLILDKEPIIEDNVILEVLFSTFKPEELGIIDYHGAHRNYQKENIQNLNLRFGDEMEHYKGSALYNYSNKYNNIKTEIASSYVKALIAKESGEEQESILSLNNSLSELFENFFPGKKFTGVVPTREGSLEFPVELKTGEKHDISELSSGEKEVLFGYLRLRNHAPKNSVILIDEPELHLNPKLAKKLPEFYNNTIGVELNNQIWLVTHSDAILKEAVGNKNFSVFHMSEAVNNQQNQLRKISFETEIEAALIDLIGDISSYQQGNKVVIFEGADSEFDKKMTNSLFPEFENSINSISAGGKANVGNLQTILKAASEEGIISKRFISLTDRDSGKITQNLDTLEFSWDVYHIENYLLNEFFISQVINDSILGEENLYTKEEVLESLKECAVNSLNFHVRHELNQFTYQKLKNLINLKINENKPLSEEYYRAVLNTSKDMETITLNELSEKSLIKKEKFLENKFYNSEVPPYVGTA